MKLFTLVLVSFLMNSVFANSAIVDNEEKYFQWKDQIESGLLVKSKLTREEEKYYIDAVWDTFTSGKGKRSLLKEIIQQEWAIEESFRLELLGVMYLKRTSATQRFKGQLKETKVFSKRLKILIASYPDESRLLIPGEQFHEIISAVSMPVFRNKTNEELQDLYDYSPDLVSYRGGEYSNSVKLFVFCRKNRLYPCMMLMKDIYNNPVYLGDTLWHQQALGSSSRGLPYNKVNGNTPSGVHTMDSVMPEANRPLAFGKYRRVILQFSPDDLDTSILLPNSAQDKTWWKQASIARDVGRAHLRIHGTGRQNTDPTTPFYPLRQTAGCISQKEGIYNNQEYKEQRVLLDTLMQAMEFDPIFDNEVKIKGILYLVEIDNKNESIALSEIKEKLELSF